MDKTYFGEMVRNLEGLEKQGQLKGRIYLFGHCNATEELLELLLTKGYHPIAILDNNIEKQGRKVRGIDIISPMSFPMEDDSIVCIVARAYEAMSEQLKSLGYHGKVIRMVTYNSYAEYSLSDETVARMMQRVNAGQVEFDRLKGKYEGAFFIMCPFAALGDIYIMMSYLPFFLQQRSIKKCVVCVIGGACRQVVGLYGDYQVEAFSQDQMDKMIQAALYSRDENVYIPHQDRPYTVNLSRILYQRLITLDEMYRYGVFALGREIQPVRPKCFKEYSGMEDIQEGNTVILSPYAKSVPELSKDFWEKIADYYLSLGMKCFTNVVGEEKVIAGTEPISPLISEMQCVVEKAGFYVGIRSGLCDVIKYASAKKIAIYPDYYYSDTKWKAIDVYCLDGWKNIEIKGEESGEYNNVNIAEMLDI